MPFALDATAINYTRPTFWWWYPVGCSWGWVQWVCTWPYWQTGGLLSRLKNVTFSRHCGGAWWGVWHHYNYIQSVNYQKRQELIYNIGGGKEFVSIKCSFSPYLFTSWYCNSTIELLALKTLPLDGPWPLIVELWPLDSGALPYPIIVMKFTFSMHTGAVLLYIGLLFPSLSLPWSHSHWLVDVSVSFLDSVTCLIYRICVYSNFIELFYVFIFCVSATALGHDMQGLPAPNRITSNAKQVHRSQLTQAGERAGPLLRPGRSFRTRSRYSISHLFLPHQTGVPLPSVHSGPGAQRKSWCTLGIGQPSHHHHRKGLPPPLGRGPSV